MRCRFDLGSGHRLCASRPVIAGALKYPVRRLVAATLAVGDDMAPVETFEALGYFLRTESAQMGRDRLPHKPGLLNAPANPSCTGFQIFRVIDEIPVKIPGEAGEGVIGNTETGRRAGCPRTDKNIAFIRNDGPGGCKVVRSPPKETCRHGGRAFVLIAIGRGFLAAPEE